MLTNNFNPLLFFIHLALTLKTLVVNRYFNVLVSFIKHKTNHIPIDKCLGTYTQYKQTALYQLFLGFPLETFLNE